LTAWQYVRPPDLTVPGIDAQGHQWKCCSICKCRTTNTVGICQLSHFDAEHIDNYRRPTPTPPAVPLPPAPAPVPDATAPRSSMTSVANPNPIPPGPPDVSPQNPELDHDLDELQFTGMWCTTVDALFSADASATCYIPDDHILARESVNVRADVVLIAPDRIASAHVALPDHIVLAPSIIKRERVALRDDIGDDIDSEDDDDDDDSYTTTMACTFFGDVHDDTTVDIDYPTTDDEDDDESTVDTISDDDLVSDPDSVTAAVRFDIALAQSLLSENGFYDAVETCPVNTFYQGFEFFDAVSDLSTSLLPPAALPPRKYWISPLARCWDVFRPVLSSVPPLFSWFTHLVLLQTFWVFYACLGYNPLSSVSWSSGPPPSSSC
jgi:hypothetical protein